jgi:hypothetical protein
MGAYGNDCQCHVGGTPSMHRQTLWLCWAVRGKAHIPPTLIMAAGCHQSQSEGFVGFRNGTSKISLKSSKSDQWEPAGICNEHNCQGHRCGYNRAFAVGSKNNLESRLGNEMYCRMAAHVLGAMCFTNSP